MTLSDIKSYLQERRQASLTDLAARFDSDPDAVRAMLEHWQRKGKVSREAGATCSGCCQCAAGTLEIYRWNG